jgi:hypothetical protein
MSNPLQELLIPKKESRDRTVSCKQETYDILTKVSKETGRSRPEVLDAFVKAALAQFEELERQKVASILDAVEESGVANIDDVEQDGYPF